MAEHRSFTSMTGDVVLVYRNFASVWWRVPSRTPRFTMEGRANTAGSRFLNSPRCGRSSVQRNIVVQSSGVTVQRGEHTSVGRMIAARFGDMI
jgi:hypothetical protein